MRTRSIAKAEAEKRLRRGKHVMVCARCGFKSVFATKPTKARCAQCHADLKPTVAADDPFGLAQALRALGFIVPKITTADGRTERLAGDTNHPHSAPDGEDLSHE